jgi:hypothetical protein
MKIHKTIKGERFRYYVLFIPNEMKATVCFSKSETPVVCDISDDFKYINLPDDFLTPYIDGIGKVKVGKLKLDKRLQEEAKDYNKSNKP